MVRTRVVVHIDLDEDVISFESVQKRLQDILDHGYPYAPMRSVRVILITKDRRNPTSSETDG